MRVSERKERQKERGERERERMEGGRELHVELFLCRWMGVEGNETTLTALERFANQNYAYGREWLTSQVNQTATNIMSDWMIIVWMYENFAGPRSHF